MIEYLQEFKAECRTLGMEKHTIESYLSNLRLFFGYINKPPQDIKTFDLANFLNYLRFEKEVKYRGGVRVGCAKSTIKTYFSSLNAYYDFLEFNGLIENNPVTRFRRRYLRHVKKDNGPENQRQLISIRSMAKMVYTTDDLMHRAVIMTLAKTGLRKNELITLDQDDLDMSTGTIYLKPTAKRTNRIVFIDNETIDLIQHYLDHQVCVKSKALFMSKHGNRLNKNRAYELVTRNAERLGFHNPDGRLIEKLTPHCCRHWFTTFLHRGGMSRENLQALRGDVVKDAVDIYNHIDYDLLRLDYLEKIPNLKEAMLYPDSEPVNNPLIKPICSIDISQVSKGGSIEMSRQLSCELLHME